MREAMFYHTLKEGNVQCDLCPHNCCIKDGHYGRCRVRKNEKGVLYTINYGCIAAFAVDPIEKKPLYHFYPNYEILSVASFGCNMTCEFCQNYELSQSNKNIEPTAVEALVDQVNGLGIAFTYSEPTIWYEYIYDVAKALKAKDPNNKVVLVTNGFINLEPLEQLLPYVDAFNVDLKSFKDSFYETICGGKLGPVLEAIKVMSKRHLEVTTLMVTDHVSIKEVEEISRFIADIDQRIPLHLSRYFPAYKMRASATSLPIMLEACNRARRILNHVYLGNILGVNNNTLCNQCGEVLIIRENYHAKVLVKTNNCPVCGFDNKIIGVEDESE